MSIKANPAVKVKVETALSAIGKATWDAIAPAGNPFLRYDFLQSLEECGAVSPRKGWAPCHLLLEDADGQLIAALPCYLKGHSLGEYVFDQGWAAAYERAGGTYYPKLQTAVPFTPVTGPRVLMRPGAEPAAVYAAFFAAARQLCLANGASSWHITFPTQQEWEAFGRLGLLQRTDTQYHWHNAGYTSFDDFLANLASRKRKTVRKERAQARAADISIEWLTGTDITEAHWDEFFAFYMDTGSRKWGSPYLNRKFFSLFGQAMAPAILLVMARRAGRYIAGALNFIGDDTLFGRYWGCLEMHNFLHFEVCYYQAIDYAIAHNLSFVEAGAQGEHKLARGYLPRPTYSLHYFADRGLKAAVARYLEEERAAVEREQTLLAEMAPFKKTCQNEP